MVQLIVRVDDKAPDAVPAEKHLLGDDVGLLRLSHSSDRHLFRPDSLMHTGGPSKAVRCLHAAGQNAHPQLESSCLGPCSGHQHTSDKGRIT